MGQQPTLFDPPEEEWIARIWRTLEPRRCQEIVSALAEMGCAAMGRHRRQPRSAKGRRHEP
jgi:hypothetical protein